MRVELTYITKTRFAFLVRSERLELSRIAPHAPQACPSTSSDMTAYSWSGYPVTLRDLMLGKHL